MDFLANNHTASSKNGMASVFSQDRLFRLEFLDENIQLPTVLEMQPPLLFVLPYPYPHHFPLFSE